MYTPYYPDEDTQGNQSNRNNLKLTKDGVHHVMLSKSNPAVGRILPAFDFSLNPKDGAFPTSFSPYRDKDKLSDQGIPVFLSWFYYYPMHTYLGKSKHFFVSPRIRKSFNPGAAAIDCFDPVEEMFWKIRRNDTQHMHLRYLVMKPQNSTEVVNLPLAAARRLAVTNFYGSVDPKNDNSNFLLILSEMGMNMSKALLDEAGLRSQAPRDPNWQDFLFGDVTHPITGLEARATTKVATGNNERGIGINTLVFSNGDKTLAGSREVPVGAEALAGRYNFFDIENVWNIPHPQVIVDRLVDDNEIPLEFMKEVCGNFCDFPSKQSPTFSSDSTAFPAQSSPGASTPEPEIPRVFVNAEEDMRNNPPQSQNVNRLGPNHPETQAVLQREQLPVPQAQVPDPNTANTIYEQRPAGPPATETDAEFANRIDAELAELAKTDPTVHFVSYLKDSNLILRYVNGKK